jgi:hypothetical protein
MSIFTTIGLEGLYMKLRKMAVEESFSCCSSIVEKKSKIISYRDINLETFSTYEDRSINKPSLFLTLLH